MATFTSSLPQDILDRWESMAKKLNIPKNKILRLALDYYLEQIERKLYIQSYQKLSEDNDVLSIAEEGIEDYLTQLIDWDEKG